MSSTLVTGDAHTAQLKEEYERLLQSLQRERPSLFDLVHLPSLTKFKELLAEAGLLEFLKHPAALTLIAPVNEAFENMNPSMRSELEGPNRAERIQTLARTHILTAPGLLRKLRVLENGELSTEANYDMNGTEVVVNVTGEAWTGGYDAKGYGYITPGGMSYFVHSIHGVRPIAPFHTRQIAAAATNGTMTLVPEFLVGKAFLAQQHMTNWQKHFKTGDDTGQFPLWEVLTKLGFTEFCKLAERVGLKDFLNAPREKSEHIIVFSPINEAFQRIDERKLENITNTERFVKRHIFDSLCTNLLGEKNHLGENNDFQRFSSVYSLDTGRWKANNGDIRPVIRCAFPDTSSTRVRN